MSSRVGTPWMPPGLPAYRALMLCHHMPFLPSFAAELGEEGEYLVMEPALEETLEEGILRMRDKGTWKVWTWPAGSGVEQHAFYDSEAFRSFIMVGPAKLPMSPPSRMGAGVDTILHSWNPPPSHWAPAACWWS